MFDKNTCLTFILVNIISNSEEEKRCLFIFEVHLCMVFCLHIYQGLIPGQVDIANVRSYLDSLGKQLSPEAQQLLEAMESKQVVR